MSPQVAFPNLCKLGLVHTIPMKRGRPRIYTDEQRKERALVHQRRWQIIRREQRRKRRATEKAAAKAAWDALPVKQKNRVILRKRRARA